MEYQVVGKLQDIFELRKVGMSVVEIDTILNGRCFIRWYKRNRKAVHMLALATPAVTFALFGVTPAMLPFLLMKGAAIPVAAAPSANFFAGNGAILLHMMIVGFVTLVVTTFLKFTGRGDIAPLVVFVGGGIILYEVLGLFKSIYMGIATFFQM